MRSLALIVVCSLVVMVLSEQMDDLTAEKRMRQFAFAKRSPYRRFAFAKRAADAGELESEEDLQMEKRPSFAFAKRAYRQFAFAKRASPYGFAFAKRASFA